MTAAGRLGGVMNLSEEIRNKEFSVSLRGYNITEVEDYIELLLEKYDELYAENAKLADRLADLSGKYEAALAAQRNNQGANGSLDEAIAQKKREYHALCEKTESFKKEIFALYRDHIQSLASIDTSAEDKSGATRGQECSPVTEERSESKKQDQRKNAEASVPDSVKMQEPSVSAPTRVLPSLDKVRQERPPEKTIDLSTLRTGSDCVETERTKTERAQTEELPGVSSDAEKTVKTAEFSPPERADTRVLTSGLKITREPVGSAAASGHGFSELRERLRKANADVDAPAVNRKKYL